MPWQVWQTINTSREFLFDFRDPETDEEKEKGGHGFSIQARNNHQYAIFSYVKCPYMKKSNCKLYLYPVILFHICSLNIFLFSILSGQVICVSKFIKEYQHSNSKFMPRLAYKVNTVIYSS